MTDIGPNLKDRYAELGRRVETLDQEIAEGLLDGAGQDALEDLRHRRRDAIDEASDIGDALSVLESRRRQGQEEAEAKERQKHKAAARESAEAFVAAARKLDERLAHVEEAYADLRRHALDLGRSLRLAGCGDNSRVTNSVGPSMRWASWHSAPGYSEAAAVPRAPGHRREPMASLAARVVPQIDG